jgi:hypothetical protein
MSRKRQMWGSSWPILLIVAFLFLMAQIGGARWPNVWDTRIEPPPPDKIELIRTEQAPLQIGYFDLLTLTLIVLFLGFMMFAIMRHLRRPLDGLALSLITANLFFSMAYVLTVATNVFPYWAVTHPDDVYHLRVVLRWGLILSLGFGILMIVTVTNNNPNVEVMDDILHKPVNDGHQQPTSNPSPR